MKFLDSNECRQLFAGKEIYVFGAGEFGERLYKKIGETVIICAFIDNNRYGEGNYLCKKEIISLEQYKKRRTDGQPIVVSAYRHRLDISRQLEDEGFEDEKDFFIWDDMCIFHADDVTKKYIQFLKNIWQSKKRENSNKIILISFDSFHDHMSIPNACCSNYLAEKYDACIYGYCRFGISVQNASDVLLDVYKAFNMVGLVDSTLNETLQRESDEILNDLWQNLYTWADWKNITVYNICFGTTVIRDFLRENIPDYNLRTEKMHTFLKRTVDTIVFWYHYILEHDIVTVLLSDAIGWEGYIRDISITKGIPVYALECGLEKAYLDYHGHSDACLHYKDMWAELTPEEQKYGLEWAKKHISERIHGNPEEVIINCKSNFSFAEKYSENRVLAADNKIKIIICPHVFEEDAYWCGEQIFDNSYMEWLCHLGELSEKTPDYHWYLKNASVFTPQRFYDIRKSGKTLS